ncbi:MAG: zf-HC2 domain-containing protein [Acidobacteriota bacterium]
MADILCGYTADRDETLVAYLYGDIEPAQRATFDAHIATCERCRHEVADLQQVRDQLQLWTAPEAPHPLTMPASPVAGPAPPADIRAGRRGVPTWAQVAAAVLALGVSAGIGGAIANLDVRYERGALTLRTGWSRSESRAGLPATSAGASGTVPAAAGAAVPWQGDIEALERRLQTELRASPSAAARTVARTEGTATSDEALVLRRVRTLLEDSERKQRNELALRIAEVVQEFDAKRGADLANIRNLKTIQSATDVEIVRQQQWLNLLTRASVQSR